MRTTLLMVAVVLGLVVLGTAPMVAHHAFSSEFDREKPITLVGVITKMEWVNPHAWLHLLVKKPDGTVEKWMIEGGVPATLLRRGVRRSDLAVGVEVKLTGFLAKDGGNKASGGRISLPDGRNFFMGSSGTGAPPETAPTR